MKRSERTGLGQAATPGLAATAPRERRRIRARQRCARSTIENLGDAPADNGGAKPETGH
jgi:hypothetical protein